jgi:hypothetical protein
VTDNKDGIYCDERENVVIMKTFMVMMMGKIMTQKTIIMTIMKMVMMLTTIKMMNAVFKKKKRTGIILK